jgi:TldD protein
MSATSRRQFLKTASFAVASVAGSTPLRADGLFHARVSPSSPHSANALLPHPIAVEELQTLAATAIDAARRTGASFADVRVAERRTMAIGYGLGDIDPVVRLDATFDFGVRVLVDGAWAFEHGTARSAMTLESAVRRAVDSARGYGAMRYDAAFRTELAPMPAVTGEWATPMTIDPFSVPIEEQYGLLIACREAVSRISGAQVSTGSYGFDAGFTWVRETRVFASTEGTLQTQTFYRSTPNLGIVVFRGLDPARVWCRALSAKSGGYETVLIPDLQEQFKAMAEEGLRLALLPSKPMEVGRYPVIFDGFSFGALLSQTVSRALEMDRVRGDEIDASGTSYLVPVETMLGTRTFSPVLDVTAHRASPTLSAAKWDDEGVETGEYSLIQHGRVVDYHTGRDSAPLLTGWYRQHGSLPRSRGCAVAPRAGNPVLVRPPHVTVPAGTASLSDMIRGVTRGVLVCQVQYISIAPHMRAGEIPWAAFYEIDRGKVVRRIKDAGIQFGTSRLWKSLAACGDADTVCTNYTDDFKGQPWTSAPAGATVPAAFFKDVNIVSVASRY